jgi:single-strand DNA-binding protein
MPQINNVMLAGRLVDAPDGRDLPGGDSVANMRIAVDSSWKDKSGERRERTEFVDVAVFGGSARYCIERLAKGQAIVLEGQLQQDTWEDNDGNKRSKLKVKARRVQQLEWPEDKPEPGSRPARNVQPDMGDTVNENEDLPF